MISSLLGAGFKVKLFFDFYFFINSGTAGFFIFSSRGEKRLGKRRKTNESLFNSFSTIGSSYQLFWVRGC